MCRNRSSYMKKDLTAVHTTSNTISGCVLVYQLLRSDLCGVRCDVYIYSEILKDKDLDSCLPFYSHLKNTKI
jgi:hypothetical protein